MARLNKELSDLEPIVEAVQQLQAKREEVSGVRGGAAPAVLLWLPLLLLIAFTN